MSYAKLSEVVQGDILITDGGFTCMKADERKEVFVGENDCLYILCDEGEHYLDGQLDEGDEYMGLVKA